MHHSFGSLLKAQRNLFPAALFGAAGWDRILSLADHLPIHVIDHRFGFEFTLSDAGPVAGFCVVAPPESRLAAYYARQGSDAASVSAPALNAFMAEQTGNPNSFLNRVSHSVILEYDLLPAEQGKHGSPGIFFVPREDRKRKLACLADDPAGLYAALLAAAGWSLNPAVFRQLGRALSLLSAVSHGVIQAGVFPGRERRAIRLVVQGVACTEMPALLERLGWHPPGSPAKMAEVLAATAAFCGPTAGIGIDVTAHGVSPRLGLEFFRPVPWHWVDRFGWNSFIHQLEYLGWCLPAKAGGLRDWPRLERIFAQNAVYQARRTINHLKLVIDRGAITAKAYGSMDVKPLAT